MEYKAKGHQTDTEYDHDRQARFSQYPDMLNYMMKSQTKQSKNLQEAHRKSERVSYADMRHHGKTLAAKSNLND